MVDLVNKLKLDDQIKMLESCIKHDKNLHEELYRRGLTYDNLRYQDYSKLSTLKSEFIPINKLRLKEHSIPAVSFFSGAGGLDIGFAYAGYKNLASIENNELFCNTLRLNFPDHLVIGPPNYTGDVTHRESIAAVLKSRLSIDTAFEGVFHGGPPCQPFSIASNQRFSKTNENFKRKGFLDEEKGNLLLDYIWFISMFKPRVFIIENVPGLSDLDGGIQLKEALNHLTKLGYNITKPTVINTANYGVPQKRLRLIIVGARSKYTFKFPEPSLETMPCYGIFEMPLTNSSNHITRYHSAESVMRYMKLEYGERDQLGRVDRLNPYLPSKTVIAGGTKGGGRSHLHPYSPRTLSVRESARIQTFPDEYKFEGSVARQFTQVGNAVPPILGFNLAKEIRNQFFEHNISSSKVKSTLVEVS